MTIKQRLLGFAARVIIKKYLDGYEFPFERAIDRVERMLPPERADYYRKAKELLENPVYKLENEEEIRHWYAKLSLDSKTDIEDIAYRMALSCVQRKHQRVVNLAQMQEKIKLYDIGRKLG